MYDLRGILRLIMLMIPAFLCVLFLIQLLREQGAAKIRDRLRKVRQALPFILVISLAGSIVSVGYQNAGTNLEASFRIGYNYPTASKGLAPNHTKLDVEEILCDEVLQQAIQNGNFEGLETYELRSALKISNAWKKNSVSAENYYISTEYVVSYNATKVTQKYDCEQILRAVYEAYYDYFSNKYGRKDYVISNDFSELSNLDYLDVYTYLSRRATNIIDYMEMCRKENSAFISDKNQESFSSISKKVSNFKNVSLERFHAYVLKYGLSKDKEQYVSRLNYDNQVLNVRYMKNLAAYSVRLSAIDKYAGDITTAVLVPSRDNGGEFYQSRTKIGTDYFAAEADEYLESATDRQLEIEHNNYNIERLTAGEGGEAERAKADRMLEELKQEIESLSALAVEIVQDYDAQNLNDYMNVAYFIGEKGLKYTLNGAVKYAAILFLMASAVTFAGGGQRPRKRRGQL